MRPARRGSTSMASTGQTSTQSIQSIHWSSRAGSAFICSRDGRRVDPREHVDRAVFETRTVGDADVEVDGDVCPVDAQFLGLVDRAPDVSVVLFDNVAVLLKLGSLAFADGNAT